MAVLARDIDLGRRNVTLMGKGRKERDMPLRGRIVLAAEEYFRFDLPAPVSRAVEPDDYLLYPEKRTPDRRVYWADPKKPCASNTAVNRA